MDKIEDNIRQKAIDWWNELENEEKEKIEKDFGYFGHDIGTTEDDVIYFFKTLIVEKKEDCKCKECACNKTKKETN